MERLPAWLTAVLLLGNNSGQALLLAVGTICCWPKVMMLCGWEGITRIKVFYHCVCDHVTCAAVCLEIGIDSKYWTSLPFLLCSVLVWHNFATFYYFLFICFWSCHKLKLTMIFSHEFITRLLCWNVDNWCGVCFRSRDKTDFDVIRENHKFLWDDDDEETSW